jgi:tetratricopeptide (TPR) repeat protein/uncharacterized protein YecT (DUF1311 family)
MALRNVGYNTHLPTFRKALIARPRPQQQWDTRHQRGCPGCRGCGTRCEIQATPAADGLLVEIVEHLTDDEKNPTPCNVQCSTYIFGAPATITLMFLPDINAIERAPLKLVYAQLLFAPDSGQRLELSLEDLLKSGAAYNDKANNLELRSELADFYGAVGLQQMADETRGKVFTDEMDTVQDALSQFTNFLNSQAAFKESIEAVDKAFDKYVFVPQNIQRTPFASLSLGIYKGDATFGLFSLDTSTSVNDKRNIVVLPADNPDAFGSAELPAIILQRPDSSIVGGILADSSGYIYMIAEPVLISQWLALDAKVRLSRICNAVITKSEKSASTGEEDGALFGVTASKAQSNSGVPESEAAAHDDRGNAYHSLGDDDKAIQAYNEALQLDPKLAIAYNDRGTAYDGKGDYDRAIEDYSEAIVLDSTLAIAYSNRANNYGKKGDYDKAIEDYNVAIRLDPKNINPYNNRGYTYQLKGDYDKAIADYSEAIQLDPRNAHAYDNRGCAYEAKGNYNKAVQDCSEAIRLNPINAKAYDNRGNAYQAKGDYDLAIADYDQAIRLDGKLAAAYKNRGDAYAAKIDYDKAIDDYDNSIRLDPKLFAAYYRRGNAYYAKGDYTNAMSDFGRLIELVPNNPLGFNSAAWLYATCPKDEIRDGAKAVELATKACEMSQWKDGGAIDTLAAAEAEATKFDDAVRYEQQAIALTKAANADAQDLQTRLSLYQQNKPYRNVFTPTPIAQSSPAPLPQNSPIPFPQATASQQNKPQAPADSDMSQFITDNGAFDEDKINRYLNDSYQQCLSRFASSKQKEIVRVPQRLWIQYTDKTEAANRALGMVDSNVDQLSLIECAARGKELQHFFDEPSRSLYELTQDLDRTDAELNSLYHAIMPTLNESNKDDLLQAQRVWVSYKDANYRANALVNPQGGGLEATIIVEKRRIEELRAIYSGINLTQ